MSNNPITNTEDTLYSLDIIERIDWLETASQGPLIEDEKRELDALKKLQEQAIDYAADWEYGETLIRDSYFKDYAKELAEELGSLNSNAQWPSNCIDWDQAAWELQQDYTSVDFAGVTYWIR